MAEAYSPQLVEALLSGQDLSRQQVRDLFEAIMAGALEPPQIAAVLIALRAKGETIDEVAGAAEAMRDVASYVKVPKGTIDVCGTGGDRSGTVNVSTAAGLTVAASGIPVAKHGNRSVSSKSGSADVLTAMGVPIERTPEQAAEDLETVGFTFLFAPLFHPAMKHAIGPRRSMGVRTIFNLLGPLTNPGRVRRQVMGVFSRRWVEPLAHVLGMLGAEHAMVVHSEDGLDELSLSAETLVAEWIDGDVRVDRISPEEFGFQAATLDDLRGGDADRNADILLDAMATGEGPVAEWIILNAGAGIRVADGRSWTDAMDAARSTLQSGAVRELVERLQAR